MLLQKFLCGSGDLHSLDINSIIPSLVMDADNTSLTTVPFVDEINAVVFAMDKIGAPTLDGFLGAFYCDHWDIVGSDIVAALGFRITLVVPL